MVAACLLAATVPVVPAWADRGDITEFDLPDSSRMQALVAGPDGNLWLAGWCPPPCGPVAIIRLTPDGEATTFSAPRGSGDTPWDITVGPDGNLWVTEFEFAKVLRVTPEGEFTVFQLRAQTVSSIAAGPDGNLWVTATHCCGLGSVIYRVTLDGQATEFPLPETMGLPDQIIAGPDDRMWFTGTGQRIGAIAMDGTIQEFEVAVQPGRSIALGSDGNLWFGARGADESLIARLTPDGELTEFPIPNYVSRIAPGPDGALWATQPEVQQIVRITTEGEIEEFALPERPGFEGWPRGLAAGPDGNIWYTTFGGRVGRLEVGSTTAAVRSVERSVR
jgi:virginiamycin B lyase